MIKYLVFVAFAGFGLVMLGIGITQWFQQRRMLAAPMRVRAVIVHAKVETIVPSGDRDRRASQNSEPMTYRPTVRFRYAIDGRTYESDRLRPTFIVTDYPSRRMAETEIEKFPAGAAVDAYIGPAYPDKAFLIAEGSAGPAVFAVVGLLLPPIAWVVSTRLM